MSAAQLVEKVFDLLFLLSLPRSELARRFPKGVTFTSELAVETSVHLAWAHELLRDSSDVIAKQALESSIIELLAIDSIFSYGSKFPEFWNQDGPEWDQHWHLIASIATAGRTRLKIGDRNPDLGNSPW